MGLKFDFKAVRTRLEDISKKAQNESLDKALKAGAKPFLKEMDFNLLDHVDTGELKASLGIVSIKGSGTERKIELGSKTEDRNIIERGYYIEYGTCCIVGSHWMKRAYISAESEGKEIMFSTLWKELGF